MVLFKLLFGSLIGYAAHTLHSPAAKFGPRWGLLLRYGIGTAIILPALLLLTPDRQRTKTAMRYVAAAASVGAGVMVAHMLDSVE